MKRWRSSSSPATVQGQEFQGDGALQFGILGFVNDAHATFAELFDDFVMEYGFADHFSNCVLVQVLWIAEFYLVPFQNHRCCHGSGSANTNQPVLGVSPLHFIGKGGYNASTGGCKRMTNGN